MTTIATKDGVMACDSQWTVGDLKGVSRTKIRRLKSGAILGFSGENDSRALEKLLENVKTPQQLPLPKKLHELKQDLHAILLFPDRRIFVISTIAVTDNEHEESGVVEVSRPFWAVGAGGHLALGALWSGKSAEEAVACGIEFDPASSGTVHSLSLAAKRKR